MKFIVIMLLNLFIIIWFTSCWSNNTLKVVENTLETKAEKDITNNLTKKDVYIKNKIKLKEFDKDIKKISFLELNNSLYSNWWWNNIKEKIKILTFSWVTKENKLKATFLESFIWDYKQSLQNRKELCKNNYESLFCKKIILALTSYRPTDTKWNILENVVISVDWRRRGKLNWKNNLHLENKFIHRIKISKEWYLSFYKKIFIDSAFDIQESLNPKLLKADFSKIIKSDRKNEIKTKNFNFSIISNSFKSKNWKIYSWDIKLYVFDITSEDWDLNILNLDTFDNNKSYVWNSMVTFWMPLIKAYDSNWNELEQIKDLLWKWTIQNIWKAPWIDLKNVPKNIWLTKNSLDKYKIPPFWHLDEKAWVWVESKMKILDSKGNYEFKLF